MEKKFKFSPAVIILPIFFVIILWFIFWLQIRFDFDFVENGIYPRTLSGLQGILFSPFIHEELEHLYNNTFPLFVLLAALQFFYSKESGSVIFWGILFSGLGTWVIGRTSYHIGASGLVYVLFSFIFFKGLFTKYYNLVALSLTVVLVYGGMIWFIFPKINDNSSWEAHLSGFIVGFLMASLQKKEGYKKTIKYEWEHPDYDESQDKFMQRFDKDGNFVNVPKNEEPEPYFCSNYNIVYTIVSSNETDK